MYFKNITSLTSLKRQFRQLAKENHPDRGGDTAVMQAINAEFKSLYKIWKDRPDPEAEETGYANDGARMSASQYAEHVWSEYRWVGENFKRSNEYSTKRICEHIRTWLKETYPSYKFSVRTSHGYSIAVALMAADFYPFKDHTRLTSDDIKYHLRHDTSDSPFTERCLEVMSNVAQYVESWNFDDSDIQTDYFCVNFYSDITIGTYGRSFEYTPVSLKSTEPRYRRKVGPVGKMLREAIGSGNAFLQEKKWDGQARVIDPDSPYFLCKDDENHYPVWYSQPSLLRERLRKLSEAGVEVVTKGRKIVLVRYSDELKAALAAEEAAEDEREKAFYSELAAKKAKSPTPATKVRQSQKETASRTEEAPVAETPSVEVVDYSEKAFAVRGDTRPIASLLKSLGGKFNARLSCGPGWIFSKSKEASVRMALGMVA